MKGLKISFIAIVAVLAVSATIAAQAGIFEAKKAFVPTDCFQPTISLADAANCSTRDVVVVGDPQSDVNVNDHIFAVGPVLANPAIACSGSGVICCITLKLDPAPCPANGSLPAQPQLSFPGELPAYYRVATIFQQD